MAATDAELGAPQSGRRPERIVSTEPPGAAITISLMRQVGHDDWIADDMPVYQVPSGTPIPAVGDRVGDGPAGPLWRVAHRRFYSFRDDLGCGAEMTLTA